MNKDGRTKYEETMAIDLYELVRAGYSRKKICDFFQINMQTLKKWLAKKPLIKYAYRRARSFSKSDSNQTFLEYVYNRLTPELQEVFNELEDMSGKLTATGRMEQLLKSQGRKGRQHLLLHALVKYDFNISEACSSVNIPLSRFKKWLMLDYEFAELIKEMEEHKKNFFESALVNLVRDGNPAAIIFANRTLNKDRGYIDAKQVNVSGQIDVNHKFIDITTLELDLETKKKILEAVRMQREKKIAEREQDAHALIPQYKVRSIEAILGEEDGIQDRSRSEV